MPRRPLQIVFFVQGEGRGHMTQALALRRILADAGHRVAEVLLGRSARRAVPPFFLDKIGAPVTYFDSPNFVTDAANRGIRPAATLRYNLRKRGVYRHNLEIIHRRLRLLKPDLVVNFYEPLWGLYALTYRPSVPSVSIGHQYLYAHPDVRVRPGGPVDRLGLRLFSALTTAGAARRLALSLYPLPAVPARGLDVVPPLLRPEVRALQPTHGGHLLVYLLNSGYADEIVRWHAAHPDVRLHCFWDRPDAAPMVHYDDALTFHRLDDERFLRLMASCRGLVTTAGFETVCEAQYLGKPVMMVPVRGHAEQRCNALDAERAGAGLHSPRFDLDRFLAYLHRHATPPEPFRAWADQAPRRILAALEQAAGLADQPIPLREVG